MDFSWYQILSKDKELQQGDLIPSCPIVIPPKSYEANGEYDIDIQEIDSIVLSQSCDLRNNKIDIVLVCPYYPLKTFISFLPSDQQSPKAKSKTIENLQKGHIHSYHLINKFDQDNGNLDDYQVVDFRNVYGIQLNVLQSLVENFDERLRLLPPYREHLSQAFARYFMRVGLPQDIIVEGY